MTSLENKVLQCASGEKRLNPDELRQYFGTYASFPTWSTVTLTYLRS